MQTSPVHAASPAHKLHLVHPTSNIPDPIHPLQCQNQPLTWAHPSEQSHPGAKNFELTIITSRWWSCQSHANALKVWEMKL